MAELFSPVEYFPGVYHITDAMGVQFSLIIAPGGGGALLFDTGYGLFDPRPLLEGLLRQHGLGLENLTVVLSHAHYDHLPGARWFERFYLCRGEIPVLDTYTEEAYLRRVLAQARIRGILPAGFDEGSFLGTDYRRRAREALPQLPGLELIPLPGHTPGSLVLYVREHRLLLTGDNWNPVTWLFFPEAVPVGDYAENMRQLLPPDYRWALCPHSRELIPGGRLRRFVDGLRPALFGAAEPAETPYPAIKTLGCRPEPESLLVFRA